MRKIVFFFAFILIASLTYGQTGRSAGYFYNENFSIRTPDDFFISQRVNGESPKNYLSEEDISGSPYLFDEFIDGDIIIENYRFAGIPLRYNIYNDDIEYKNGETILAISSGLNIRRIFIFDMIFVYDAYELKNVQKFGYFQLLNDGPLKVLKKFNVSYQMPQAAQAYTSAIPPKFVRLSSKLYVKIGNTPARLYSNKKNLLAAFGDKKSAMAKYIKAERLNVKNEIDLVKLIKYYNTL